MTVNNYERPYSEWTPEQWAHTCKVAAQLAKETRTHDNPALEEAMTYLSLLFMNAHISVRSEGSVIMLPTKIR